MTAGAAADAVLTVAAGSGSGVVVAVLASALVSAASMRSGEAGAGWRRGRGVLFSAGGVGVAVTACGCTPISIICTISGWGRMFAGGVMRESQSRPSKCMATMPPARAGENRGQTGPEANRSAASVENVVAAM